MLMTPQVSVCLFSYNFEKYIAECIDSILDQETNFAYEIIIGDDVSTDRSREVAESYQRKYPDKIRLSFNTTNLGGTRNWIRTMQQAKGKYVALIDGDDYFIDRRKLQKQYDILEREPLANLCFHSVREIFEKSDNRQVDVVFPFNEYTTIDLLNQGWFMRTSSLFFRNGIMPQTPQDWVYDFPYRYDTILTVTLSLNSKAINCKDVMTVWRRHEAGLSYAITKNYYKNYTEEKSLYEHLNELSNGRYAKAIDSYIKKLRTGLVCNSIKRMSGGVLADLGLSAFNIDYKFFFQLIAASIKARFGKPTDWANS
jgi:glycosyltransferase involved in cell wall biosynthesis